MLLEQEIKRDISRINYFQNLSPDLLLSLDDEDLFAVKPIQKKYKNKLLDDISKAKISADSLNGYAWENKTLINIFYKDKVFSDGELYTSIIDAIFNRARNDFKYILRGNSKKKVHMIGTNDKLPLNKLAHLSNTGHLHSKKSFAYALLYNHFSKREERKIVYEKGDNKNSFIKDNYISSFLINLKLQFLNPIKPLSF